MEVSALPDYAQGFVFNNSSTYYDSTLKRFIDQSPYTSWDNNHLDITVGTPSFVTQGSGKGMVLDNTVQGGFLCPIPWHGTCISIIKPNMSANGTLYAVIFGASATISANSLILINRANATSYNHRFATLSATSTAQNNMTTNAVLASAFCFSQQTRTAYASKDASTIVAGSAVTDGGSGVFAFAGNTEDADNGFRARFGNISGTLGSTTVSTNTLVICELHFLRRARLTAADSDLQSVLATLQARYA